MVRLKHRYLLANILYPDADAAASTTRLKAGEDVPYAVQFRQPTPDRVDARALTQMIRNGITELFGDYGSGMIAASLQVKYFSPATSTAIIRVSREHYRLVWSTLTFTLQLPKPVNQPCVIQVVRVSGTIKKVEEEAIRRAQLSIRRAQQSAALHGKASILGADATGNSSNGIEMDVDDGFANGIDDLDGPDDEDDSD